MISIPIAIVIGFVILAVTINHTMDVRNKQYAKEQEEWRNMERELYRVNVPDTKSPYVIRKYFYTKNQKWGYSIMDTRTGGWATSNGYHQIFYTMSDALIAINQFEIVGGYDKTVLEILETPPKEDKEEES